MLNAPHSSAPRRLIGMVCCLVLGVILCPSTVEASGIPQTLLCLSDPVPDGHVVVAITTSSDCGSSSPNARFVEPIADRATLHICGPSVPDGYRVTGHFTEERCTLVQNRTLRVERVAGRNSMQVCGSFFPPGFVVTAIRNVEDCGSGIPSRSLLIERLRGQQALNICSSSIPFDYAVTSRFSNEACDSGIPALTQRIELLGTEEMDICSLQAPPGYRATRGFESAICDRFGFGDPAVTIVPDGRDPDVDGLTTWQEVRRHRTDPNIADSDCDAVNDGDEVSQGRDPNEASPLPQEEARLTATGSDGTSFGNAVALDGDTLAVGAPFADGGRGAVHIYQRRAATWVQVRRIDGPGAVFFGNAVALDGDTLAVGNGEAGNLVQIFERHRGGSDQWGSVRQWTVADVPNFGWSLDLSGDVLAVGSFDGNGSVGSVLLYERHRSGVDAWGLSHRIDATEAIGFGQSVAVHDSTIIVGALFDTTLGSSAGAAFVYERDGDDWPHVTTLFGSTSGPGDQFGIHVDVLGDVAAVGAWNADQAGPAAGAVYLFERRDGQWSERDTLTTGNGGSQLGVSVALASEDRLVAGALQAEVCGADTGAAWVFERSADGWSETLHLSAPGGQDNDRFGVAVAASGGAAVAGADHVVGNDGQDGAVHLFRLDPEPNPCGLADGGVCLSGGRFRVEVTWRDFNGTAGIGRAVPFGSDDSGLLWFFGPNNWEMLVKVIDGCTFNDRFWVFAATTTNVEYTLTVTDTVTGDAQTYFNALGEAAPAIADTNALTGCAAPLQPPAPQRPGNPADIAGVQPPVLGSANPTKVDAAACGGQEGLCLGNERFRIELTWRDFEGNTGSGRAVPFRSDDSGLLWFFGPNNWELLIKVIDGCAFNGNIWVLAAATTNVEYTLTVTDTVTGTTTSYFNPLGTAAAAIIDTEALAVCPEGPPTRQGGLSL